MAVGTWVGAVSFLAFVVWRLWRLTAELRVAAATNDQTRRLLRQQESQRDALCGALSDFVFGLAPDGRVTPLGGPPLPGLSASCSGAEPRASTGVVLRDLFAEETAELLMRSAQAVRATGALVLCDHEVGEASALRALEVRVAPGEAESVVVLVRDVTQQQRLRRDFESARDTALEAARLKTQFLANMSHEIRTPMNGVIGMTNLLLETPLSAEQHEYAQIIQKSGQTLLLVIDDILDFAKIEAGKLELDDVEFDLYACVDECVEAVASQAQLKGLELGAVFDTGVPSHARGDPTRLRQILANLLSNAVRFTDSGSVMVRVKPEGGAEPGRLCVSVHDSGPGIAKERLPALFQPVLLGDGSSLSASGGTGLGLVITRELVQLMGGEIRCRSAPGRGSVFELSVRLLPRELPSTPSERVAIPIAGTRVVALSDASAVPWFLEQQLAELGVDAPRVQADAVVDRVVAAQEAGGCLALIIDARMDAAVMAQAVRDVRRHPQTRELALVLVSPLHLDLSEDVRAAAARILAWPVRQSELSACLSALRQRPQTSRTGEPRTAERLLAHVLVADDDPINQRILRRVLSQLGCTCVVADDGQKAVERALGERFDAILMDCQMPWLDGFEAARQIRAREDSRRPNRIVALTGSTSDEDRRLSREAGMDGFLTKPVSNQQLGAELARLIGPCPERHALRQGFVEQTPRNIEAMRAALDVDDMPAVARSARQLSALAADLQENHLAGLCDALMRAAEERALPATERALELVNVEHAVVLRRLREHLDSSPPTTA